MNIRDLQEAAQAAPSIHTVPRRTWISVNFVFAQIKTRFNSAYPGVCVFSLLSSCHAALLLLS